LSKEKLIVELDGNPHGEYHKISEDIKRDEFLQNSGFTVLRFENRFVFPDPEYILKEISKKFNNHPGPEIDRN
jgi:very-short-patch-repair endonuclease